VNDIALVQAWRDAAQDASIVSVLEAVYDYVAEAIAQRGPVCKASGRCCRFEEYGHRLYVTGLETAYLVTRLEETHPTLSEDALQSAVESGRCPFQIENLCDVHPLRPLGCRVYFCDPVAQGWQETLSEKMLEQIRGIHQAHDIPYRYGEWRQTLRMFVKER